METDPMKILTDRKVSQTRLKPILKTIFMSTGRLMQQQDHNQIYPFICKVKRAVKTLMALDPHSCYLALIVLQDYNRIDNFAYDLSRVRAQVVDQKTMPHQVECILVLSNGDIAISGGQYRFEISIYRHDLNRKGAGVTGRDREKLKLVDSIDTGGMQVL